MAHCRTVVDSHAEFVTAASKWLEREIDRCIRMTGRCSIALSGGTTPRLIYARLALSPRIAWDRLHVYFGDERCVPPDHSASNYRMVSETLLSSAKIPRGQVHRIQGERSDFAQAALEYAELLTEPLDIIVLGVGADGHTASLFPGSLALLETSRHVLHSQSPSPPRDRITITPPVIANAGALLVLALGPDKAAAVARACEPETDPNEVPARLALSGTWIMDRAAAGNVAESG